MDLPLLVHMARTFEQREEEARNNATSVLEYANSIASLHTYTAKYWYTVLAQIDRRER